MTSGDPDESFKVTDRRRRLDDDDRLEPVSPPPSSPPASPAPSPEVRPPLEPGGSESAERSLMGLFMMLGSSALIALGEAADPMTGQRHGDPDQAAEVIDLLVLLREKTEGRRSAEESEVLENLIYDLQLRFVNATRRPR